MSKPPPRIAPSVLAADFARLGEQVREVVAAGAGVIHIDIMDGHFVPPLSMGPPVVSALRALDGLEDVFLDVHLMVERPERQIADFVSAGAHGITIHAEATPHLNYVLEEIRSAGLVAGLGVCPSTPLEVFAEVDADLALCMTVNPGWGGQPFIQSSIQKIERLRTIVGERVELEVDGGIDVRTAGPCANAGASLFVAGSAIFRAAEPGLAYQEIAAAAGCG